MITDDRALIDRPFFLPELQIGDRVKIIIELGGLLITVKIFRDGELIRSLRFCPLLRWRYIRELFRVLDTPSFERTWAGGPADNERFYNFVGYHFHNKEGAR